MACWARVSYSLVLSRAAAAGPGLGDLHHAHSLIAEAERHREHRLLSPLHHARAQRRFEIRVRQLDLAHRATLEHDSIPGVVVQRVAGARGVGVHV